MYENDFVPRFNKAKVGGAAKDGNRTPLAFYPDYFWPFGTLLGIAGRRGYGSPVGVLVLALCRSIKQESIGKAHFPTQHIYELRQGVDTRLLKKLANPCRFVRPRPSRISRIVHSRAECQHFKTAATRTDALTSLQDRPWCLPTNGRRNDEQQRRRDRQNQAGDPKFAETPHPICAAVLVKARQQSRFSNTPHFRTMSPRCSGCINHRLLSEARVGVMTRRSGKIQ